MSQPHIAAVAWNYVVLAQKHVVFLLKTLRNVQMQKSISFLLRLRVSFTSKNLYYEVDIFCYYYYCK